MFDDWRLRLRSILRRGDVERELDDELAFHLEQQIDVFIRQGVPRDEAIRRARLAVGGFDQIREEHRDARGTRALGDAGRDLGYALRQLRRAPGFAALAIGCLGLGIGVNAAMFSVLNSVLFRPLAVERPDDLVILRRGEHATFSTAVFRELQTRARTLSGLTASFPMESDLEVDGESRFIAAEVVAGNYGAVVGGRLLQGRWFTSDTEASAVISHAVWRDRFRLRPDIIGQLIASESQSYAIVGVASPDFTGVFAPIRTDIWVPLRTRPTLASILDNPARQPLMLFGQPADGTGVAAVTAELSTITGQLPMVDRADTPSLPIVAERVRGVANPGGRRIFAAIASVLSGVVAVILLIACVNVGHLLLVRGTLRQRELAVRRALGASQPRLIRQLLTESLVLAIAGGLCGILLALWTNALLRRWLPALTAPFPVQMPLALDWRVLTFTLIVSLITTVVCALLPAWRTAAASHPATLKGEVRGASPRRRPLGLVAQVLLSFVLLLVAGTMIEALDRLTQVDPGFATERRLFALTFVPAPPAPPDPRAEITAAMRDRVQALPGVRRVTRISTMPMMPSGSECAALGAGPRHAITSTAIDRDYFETMAIPIVLGRGFDSGDLAGEAARVVITESLARRLWPGASPIGQQLMVGCDAPHGATVIGVVRDSTIRALGEAPQPHLYRPFGREHAGRLTTLMIEAAGDPGALVPLVRRTLLDTGHGIRVYDVRPLRAYVDEQLADTKAQAVILSGFGLLALLLAATGLYGVIACRVTLRTQEIGVRMALGAQRAAILREVLGHGLAIVLAGLAIGELLSIPAVRVLAAVRPEFEPTGAVTHATAAVIWMVVALVACYLPAIRAARVDPVVALRHE